MAACVSTALGGGAAVATRALSEDVGPVNMGLIRYGIAVACLVPAAMLIHGSRFERHDLLPMALVGIMFFGVFPVGFALSFKYTTAAQGALTLSLMPVMTMLFAALLGKEIITRAKVLGAACVIAGVALVVDPDDQAASDPILGNSIMFFMAMLGAMFNTLARPYLQQYDQLQATAWFMTCGWCVLLMVTLSAGLVEPVMPPVETWWLLLFLGTFGGAVPIFLFNWALGHIESTLVSVAVGLNPLTAAVFGILLLSEPLTLSLVAGLALVLAGITSANWRGRKYDAARNQVSSS
jgi:drug/metabolite transporter (DMT)-like permease